MTRKFVSFDVSLEFNSVPIAETLKYLANLLQKNNIGTDKIREYIDITSFFLFNSLYKPCVVKILKVFCFVESSAFN